MTKAEVHAWFGGFCLGGLTILFLVMFGVIN